MELGKAYVQVIPTTKGISQNLTNELNAAGGPAGTAAGNTIGNNMTRSISSRMKSVGKGMMAAGAIATAVSVPIINGIKNAMDAYSVQATAETKLTEIYKTRMGVSDQAAKKTMELASALQQEGVIGDEVAISGAQQLATFAKYPSTVNTLMPAMNNLLAQQKGLNATTDDAVSIGNLMGKVMQGQTGALKRVGISFTEAQEEVLKYGTEEERAAMLSEVITSNVGNMNSELAKTSAGKMQQLNNTLGDMKEQVGSALAPVLERLAIIISEKVVPMVERLINFMVTHPIISKIIIGITGLLAVGGPLLIIIGSIVTAVSALGPMLAFLTGPIGLIIAGIVAAVAAGIALYKNWNKIKAFAAKVWGAIKANVMSKVTALKNGIHKAFNAVKTKITTILTGIRTRMSTVWTTIKTTASKAWTKIKEAITKPIQKAKEKVSDIIGKLKDLFPIKIGKLLSGIKLPSFSLKSSTKDYGKLGKVNYPTGMGVKWHAKGGIFDQPTIAGIGEAGPEAVVPLNSFWNRMDENKIDYEALAGALLYALRGANMTNELVVDGRVVAKSVSPFLQDELDKQQTRTNRRLGLVY